MGWLIAALVLSALVLGGVKFYTSLDSANVKKNKNDAKETGISDVLPGSKKSVSLKDVWDIEEIRDSIIFLSNNRYSAVIKVGAIDFRMMSEQQQEAVEAALVQAALSLSFDVQLYASSEYIDIEAIREEIASARDDNEKMAVYRKEAVSYLDDMMKSRNTIRRNYIIVSCSGSPEKAYTELNRYCNIVISGLQRAKVPAHRLTSAEMLDLVYARLNRGSSTKPSAVAANGAFELYVNGQNTGGV